MLLYKRRPDHINMVMSLFCVCLALDFLEGLLRRYRVLRNFFFLSVSVEGPQAVQYIARTSG